MKLSKVNEALSLLANLGVLVGIIFLIIQINQSNRIALGTAESTIRELGITLNGRPIENPQVAELYSKLTQPDPDLTDSETEQARAIVRQTYNFWITIERNYQQGLITESSFEEFKRDPSGFLGSYPGLLTLFERGLRLFPRPYTLEMHKAIDDEIMKLRQ